MTRAFAALIQILLTMLSTAFVDNRIQPASQAGFRGPAMKMPLHLLRYLPVARRILSAGRLPALLLAVARKSSRQRGRNPGLLGNLRLLQALCLAYWRGEYRAVSRQALLAAVAGLVYFLSPVDLVPDFLFGFGLLDDLAVLGWISRTWSRELEAFRVWQESQAPTRRQALERLPSKEEIEARRGQADERD
jgi:uncharacterized membrane protein YkvA (DUF1232 family)